MLDAQLPRIKLTASKVINNEDLFTMTS
jgi:hypothetical protein